MMPLTLNPWNHSKNRSPDMQKPQKNGTKCPSVPYGQLAEIYDYVMRHVDYENWADYIESVFTRYKVTPSTILELACGTGNMATILSTRGYQVSGIDRSAGMVSIAQQKVQDGHITATFQQGDMVDPPIHENTFDAILCLYDSVNYLMDVEALRQMLDRVFTSLRPDGILIFDTCTELNSRRFFYNEVDQESTDHFSYIRHSEYLAQERIQVNEFQMVFNHDGKHDEYFERHEQRIYPIDQIKHICKEAGFRRIDTFDGFTFKNASEKSNRVHFVMRPF